MNITNNRASLKSKLAIALLPILLTSCATYKSGFTCGDARGVPCTMMEQVDQLISSGEIESYTARKKNCRGRSCKSTGQQDALQSALVNNQRS
jgi:hypothetical protein